MEICEAAGKIVCSGARPLALTDCLNFGDLFNPEVFSKFKKSVEGITAACKKLDIPVVSGNVSFHNESPSGSVDPTPAIGMIGVIDEVDKFISAHFKDEGDVVLLIGETLEELGGSQYLKIVHNLKKGKPPHLDLDREKLNQEFVQELIKRSLIKSAHDLSEGGLAVALTESCIAGEGKMVGVNIKCEIGDIRKDAFLFGESQSRILVSCPPSVLPKIESLAKQKKVPLYNIGYVGGNRLIVNDLLGLQIEELSKPWRNAIPEGIK